MKEIKIEIVKEKEKKREIGKEKGTRELGKEK